jgi:hypothetical protein
MSGEVGMVTTLSRADRCDRCGAAAQVRVEMTAGELLFCQHHANGSVQRLPTLAAHTIAASDHTAERVGAHDGQAVRIAVTLLGLDLFTIEASTDAECEEPGDAMSYPVGFTPTPARPRELGEDYE